MLNRLTGPGLRVRVGIATALIAGGLTHIIFGAGWLTVVIAIGAGVVAAVKTPSVIDTSKLQ